MNWLGVLFLFVALAALVAVPRRWAPLPLLMGACYMTLAQAVQIGPFNFTLIRLLLLGGFIRVLSRHERPLGGFMAMDWLLLAWAGWALICSKFRLHSMDTLINHLGMVYNTLGIYFLTRCFCRSEQDVRRIILMIAIVLIPVALEMLNEQLTHRNLFASLGGVPEEPAIRNDRLRSQGPFAHAILAGTVGAVCAPLMIGIWRDHPRVAKIGLAACLLMVIASASSGPLMSVIFAALALLFWHWRHHSRKLVWAAIIGYILLDMVMKAPAYYLLARIDVTGSSSSYHRAALIEAGIEHFDEWWFCGTDYTRHWMPTGVSWSEDHADITNHYLAQGVRGGFLLMLSFIGMLWLGFRYVGQCSMHINSASPKSQYLAWCLGASLFAHAATCISVAYFDQSVIFLYIILASIGSLKNGKVLEQKWGLPPAISIAVS